MITIEASNDVVVKILGKQAGPVKRAHERMLSCAGKRGHCRDPIQDDLTCAAASRDCGEVDLGVVDAVEDVGEDSGCEGHDEELIAEIVGNVPDGQSSAADIRILSRGS